MEGEKRKGAEAEEAGAMSLHRGKAAMLERYGDIGEGSKRIRVGGTEYGLKQVLAKWMMDVPEVWTLDGGELPGGRYWIRFLDADDRCVVVFEFDGNFDILSEARVDSLAWEGEDFFKSRTR
jgi:transposase InsO family protein